MKKLFKAVAAIAAALFLFYVLAALIVWHDVATGKDRDTTDLIRRDFTEAVGTNFQQMHFLVTPTHQKALIIVRGTLSEDDRQKLALIARDVSARNGNYKVSIAYRP